MVEDTEYNKRHMWQFLEEARCKLPRVLSSGVTQDAFSFSSNQSIVTTYMKCCLPGKLIRNSVVGVSVGNRSCRHPLSSCSKIEGSQKENRCSV